MKNDQHTGLIFLIFLFLQLVRSPSTLAQEQYKIGCIGFYNLENLFDTIDQPGTEDEEFTPSGARAWTPELYRGKIDRLARVIEELGVDLTPDGAALLGVAEVENRAVLEALTAHPRLQGRDYQIVHYDSPDQRGIDVALLYQAKYFRVQHSRPIPVPVGQTGGRPTRDILYVTGLFDGEPLHVLVNHWPSRSGGIRATAGYRNAAAAICRAVSDSLRRLGPNARIIIMGDFNDDPVSPSVRQVLSAKRKIQQVSAGDFYNPMYDFFKNGYGTLAYRDAWNLFDQILLSQSLLNPPNDGYRFYQARIHQREYLLQSSGQYKGYPFRTFAGNTYLGGYSDHFPVCIFIIKPVRARED
jgi:endonuclease/exonuclease/phosphatase family metal-dependent hydrolase